MTMRHTEPRPQQKTERYHEWRGPCGFCGELRGDSHRCEAPRPATEEEFVKAAPRLLWRWRNDPEHRSFAAEGLWVAWNTHTPSKGRWVPWAFKHMRWAVQEGKRQDNLDQQGQARRHGKYVQKWARGLHTPRWVDRFEQIEVRMVLRDALKRDLSPKERKIVNAHYLEDPAMTLKEIAGDEGMSYWGARKANRVALDKLREDEELQQLPREIARLPATVPDQGAGPETS